MGNKRDIRTIVANTTAKKALHVEVYNNFEELEAIQQEWDNFVESVGSEIFLTYDWCRIWWKYYRKNRDLRVFVFRSNNELVGIIPLFFEKFWLGPVFVKAGKIVGSDYTLSQFSIPIASDHIKAVVDNFYDLISKEYWDILHMGPIAGLYNHYDELRAAMVKATSGSHRMLVEEKGVQTYFKLTDTWDEYLAGLKKKERQLIRSCYRKIDKEKMKLRISYATEDSFDHQFEAFAKTHQLLWHKKGKLGHFGDWPDSLEFHREMAYTQLKNNRLRLLEVRLSNNCVAYQYSYRFGNRFLELLVGRSLSSDLIHIDLGKLIFAEQAKCAINQGVDCIDSMRGSYEYKLRLGGKLFPIRNIYIIQNNLFVSIRVSIFRILVRLLHMSYYKIWFCRIAPKLPLKRGPLWRFWIRTNGFS